MTPPRILVDATAIPRDRGGVGRYLDGLLAALAEGSGLPGAAQISVICQEHDAGVFATLGLNVIVAPRSIERTPVRLLWEQFALPSIVRRGGFDVLHSPHYTFPLRGRFGRVVTIHDLTFFTLPQTHSVGKRAFFRFWLRRLARRRFPVIAVSAATAEEFVRLLHADPARLTVALHGYDAQVFRVPTSEQLAAFATRLTPPVTRWIAFLGTLEPRKNVAALVAAYVALEPAGRPALLLAGGAGWDAAVAPAVAAATASGADVRLLGYLPIDELSAFLGGAELVAYPSLGEGFGLPVLEAMAAGACVLTTAELALPEVGGEAVAYAGTSAPELTAALTALLADQPRRDDFRRRAVERAAGFTWQAAAATHRAAYATAAAAKAAR